MGVFSRSRDMISDERFYSLTRIDSYCEWVVNGLGLSSVEPFLFGLVLSLYVHCFSICALFQYSAFGVLEVDDLRYNILPGHHIVRCLS